MDDLNKQYSEEYDDQYLEEYDDVDNECDNLNIIDNEYTENCVNCYYSDMGYCPIHCMHITIKTPICWSYRNWLTMRASSDFQDDNEDFYEYE